MDADRHLLTARAQQGAAPDGRATCERPRVSAGPDEIQHGLNTHNGLIRSGDITAFR